MGVDPAHPSFHRTRSGFAWPFGPPPLKDEEEANEETAELVGPAYGAAEAAANMVDILDKIPSEVAKGCRYDGRFEGAAVWQQTCMMALRPRLGPWYSGVLTGTVAPKNAAQHAKVREMLCAVAS